jgi:hypothetical protein
MKLSNSVTPSQHRAHSLAAVAAATRANQLRSWLAPMQSEMTMRVSELAAAQGAAQSSLIYAAQPVSSDLTY